VGNKCRTSHDQNDRNNNFCKCSYDSNYLNHVILHLQEIFKDRWLNIGFYLIKLDAERWCSKPIYNCISMTYGKIQIPRLTHGYRDFLNPDVFQNVMSKLVQDMEYVKTIILPWWLVNTNKYQLQRPST
jgi:hypothetical protein